tara:strand:- start:555 stop:764 length:210 start_codon:yes stop_codon:yes gene_type:complete
MTKTEIKKALYRQKPEASLLKIRLSVAYYEASLEDGTVIYFEIPTEDMGDADFFPIMENAQHLNRWINE